LLQKNRGVKSKNTLKTNIKNPKNNFKNTNPYKKQGKNIKNKKHQIKNKFLIYNKEIFKILTKTNTKEYQILTFTSR
jgi:hypothetical protein